VTERLSHDDAMMQAAAVFARRSLCFRSRVGAVACASDRRLVSVGWNAPPAGVDTGGRGCELWCPRGAGLSHKPGYADCFAIHAEANALIHAERGELIGGTMYLTRVPCSPCAKQIAAAGVTRVVCGVDDGGVFHRPQEVVEILLACGVAVEEYGG
jgi:deoxycytidylate deaminase